MSPSSPAEGCSPQSNKSVSNTEQDPLVVAHVATALNVKEAQTNLSTLNKSIHVAFDYVVRAKAKEVWTYSSLLRDQGDNPLELLQNSAVMDIGKAAHVLEQTMDTVGTLNKTLDDVQKLLALVSENLEQQYGKKWVQLEAMVGKVRSEIGQWAGKSEEGRARSRSAGSVLLSRPLLPSGVSDDTSPLTSRAWGSEAAVNDVPSPVRSPAKEHSHLPRREDNGALSPDRREGNGASSSDGKDCNGGLPGEDWDETRELREEGRDKVSKLGEAAGPWAGSTPGWDGCNGSNGALEGEEVSPGMCWMCHMLAEKNDELDERCLELQSEIVVLQGDLSHARSQVTNKELTIENLLAGIRATEECMRTEKKELVTKVEWLEDALLSRMDGKRSSSGGRGPTSKASVSSSAVTLGAPPCPQMDASDDDDDDTEQDLSTLGGDAEEDVDVDVDASQDTEDFLERSKAHDLLEQGDQVPEAILEAGPLRLGRDDDDADAEEEVLEDDPHNSSFLISPHPSGYAASDPGHRAPGQPQSPQESLNSWGELAEGDEEAFLAGEGGARSGGLGHDDMDEYRLRFMMSAQGETALSDPGNGPWELGQSARRKSLLSRGARREDDADGGEALPPPPDSPTGAPDELGVTPKAKEEQSFFGYMFGYT